MDKTADARWNPQALYAKTNIWKKKKKVKVNNP